MFEQLTEPKELKINKQIKIPRINDDIMGIGMRIDGCDAYGVDLHSRFICASMPWLIERHRGIERAIFVNWVIFDVIMLIRKCWTAQSNIEFVL